MFIMANIEKELGIEFRILLIFIIIFKLNFLMKKIYELCFTKL